MNRGIYPPLAEAIALERRLGVLAQNVSNINTAGYKNDKPVFETILARMNGPRTAGIDLFPDVALVRPDRSQGVLQHTGQPFDLALKGEGFFVVQTQAGPRFYRGGSLHRDVKGTLVTHTGDPLLGKSGPIALPPGPMVVNESGAVSVNNKKVGQLRLEQVPDSSLPMKVGDLFWRIPQGAVPTTTVRVQQGMLEKSNVHPSTGLLEMIQVTRGYEQMQKAIRTMDEMTGQVIQAARVQR